MRVHTYVVQHDKGFAPNPFWGVCTLACCKPKIRKRAEVGDVIIGFGSASKEVDLKNRVIYWMRVEKIISFDDYWNDPQYAAKRPEDKSSLMVWYGDNIYHRDEDSGEWIQAYSFHKDGARLGRGNLERDTGTTDRVLISKDYAYWGGHAPFFPDALLDLVPLGRAGRNNYADSQKEKILDWIKSIPERGFQHEPADWCRDHASKPEADASLTHIADYAHRAAKTNQLDTETKRRSKEEQRRILIYGLVSEIGSVISAVKKQKLGESGHRDTTEGTLTRHELKDELGDLIWYCFALAALENDGDNDILTQQIEVLSEHLKGDDKQPASFGEFLNRAQIEDFQQRTKEFLGKKPRTFQDFQKIAYLTARAHGDELVEISLVTLTELAAQLMRLLLSESEKQLHDQVQDRPALNILGKIAWHIAAIATVYKLHLDEIAYENIEKIQPRRPAIDVTPLHDKKYPESEQLPRQFEVKFLTVGKGISRMYWGGNQLGNDLRDNFYKEDGYRFHDALHLANMAHLGWSPVFRGFMGKKRKSNLEIDEIEDGGRARAVEEAVIKAIHSEGEEIAEILHPGLALKDRPIFSDDVDIPLSFFNIIRRYVKGLEVGSNSFHEWKNAIRDGFRIYKELAKHGQGTVTVNLDKRKIDFCPEVYVDIVGTVVGVGSYAISLSEFGKDAQEEAWLLMTEAECHRLNGTEHVCLARYLAAKYAILQALGIDCSNPRDFTALISLTEMNLGKFSVKVDAQLQKMMWEQKVVAFKISVSQNQSSVCCTALASSDVPKKKG